MLAVLQFTFSDLPHFCGTILLIFAVCFGVALIVDAARK